MIQDLQPTAVSKTSFIFQFPSSNSVDKIRNSEATLVKGLIKTNVFKFSFFNRIVDLWNCLPLDIRTIITEHLSSFKNSINKFYLNKFNVNIRIDFYN